jgi:hypothetical protein
VTDLLPDRRQFLQSTARTVLLVGGAALLRSTTSFAAPATQPDTIARITELAASSPIASYDFKNRGKAPPGYIKGMAVSYAKVYSGLKAGDTYALEMAKPVGADATKDALAHYAEIFKAADMDNSRAGPDTLRHLFVLMLGLGMRESSGRYCEGRDRSASNTTAETAEAGLFQTSYNARHASPLMPKLFAQFMAKPSPSYLDIFAEGVQAKDSELENYGDGDGRDFQKLSKSCPFFALEFAALGLRNIRKHWGPINRREAEIRPDADALFREVQTLVDASAHGI